MGRRQFIGSGEERGRDGLGLDLKPVRRARGGEAMHMHALGKGCQAWRRTHYAHVHACTNAKKKKKKILSFVLLYTRTRAQYGAWCALIGIYISRSVRGCDARKAASY
jgi:hypothetical protein